MMTTSAPPAAVVGVDNRRRNGRPVGSRHARRPLTTRRVTVVRWVITTAATAGSALALDVTATAVGVLVVATHVLHDASLVVLLAVLATTYGLWAAGLRVNVVANGRLLEATGTSTSVLSKLLFDAAWRRAWSPRAARAASAAGYVTLEAAKEIPYYAGAFGSALVTDHVDAAEAIIFLAGSNVGAAVYEIGLAHLTRRGLAWRSRRAVRPLPASTPIGTVA
jgi:hypothetical protein